MELKDGFEREYPLSSILRAVDCGWHFLIVELIEDLEELGWDGRIHQVKEKFGGLRFYIGGGSDEIYDRIDEAEALSFKTCEQCGAEGVPRNDGWIKTRCADCQRTRKMNELARSTG